MSAGSERSLEQLDWQLGRLLAELSGDSQREIEYATALLSAAVRAGHVCLDLHRLPVQGWGDSALPPRFESRNTQDWLVALRRSRVVSSGDGDTPLVLDAAGRLYLRRYWEYERQVATSLQERARVADTGRLSPEIRRLVRELFALRGAEAEGLNWQQVAALVALRRRLCVIAGGPGTGKTYSVANLLVLLFARALECRQPWPKVELLAPTGKAAQRLSESLQANKQNIRKLASDRRLPLALEVLDAIPVEAKTIHRCLGTVGESSVRFYHNAENPLVVDVVIVDESSMIDLSLMAHLLAAVPENARLVLLGDENQLASVEAGSVLGDICNVGTDSTFSRPQWQWLERESEGSISAPAHAPEQEGLWDCIVRLRRNFRYSSHSGIGQLAEAIRRGESDQAWHVLHSGDSTVSVAPPLPPWQLGPYLASACRTKFAAYVAKDDALARLREFASFRVLCAHRTGPAGVAFMNRAIERELEEAGLLRSTTDRWYDARPVLITENNYWVRLFNGDLGVVMVRPGQPPRVVFPGSSPGSVREFAPGRLPEHETAFAMTVHKSQGSEFDEVEVVLPQHGSPLLTRELLYTAVTRAKRCVRVHADRASFEQAVRQRIERSSGLRDALWRLAGPR